MELCTAPTLSTQPHHKFFFASSSKPHLPHNHISISPPNSRMLSSFMLRASMSEDSTSGTTQWAGGKSAVITVEDGPIVEQNVYNETLKTELIEEESPVAQQSESLEILDRLNIKFDSEDTYSILIYGSGALVTLWLASAVVGAFDSIPVFPKLMEIVGLGYTIWFSTRYLIFKSSRDELVGKIEELKEEVFGSSDE